MIMDKSIAIRLKSNLGGLLIFPNTQLNIWSTQKQIFERKPEHDSALVVPIKSAQLRCASSTSHNNQQGEVLQNSFLSPQASIGFPHCGQVGGSTGAAHHNDLKSRHEPTFNPQSPYNTTTPNLHCLPFNIYPCFWFSQLGFPWKNSLVATKWPHLRI